jgi:hypothetical protein
MEGGRKNLDRELEYFEGVLRYCICAGTGVKRVCLLVFLRLFFPRFAPIKILLLLCY